MQYMHTHKNKMTTQIWGQFFSKKSKELNWEFPILRIGVKIDRFIFQILNSCLLDEVTHEEKVLYTIRDEKDFKKKSFFCWWFGEWTVLSADCRLTWRMASLLRSPTRVMPLQKRASTDRISHENRISYGGRDGRREGRKKRRSVH